MPRGLESESVAELDKDGQYVFHMVEIILDDETLRYTNAHAEVSYEGETYTPSGNLISFGDVTETEALVLNSMAFKLSGVELTMFALVLSQDLLNRKINLYQGLIDPDTYAIIPSPIGVYSGKIKSISLQETPGDKSVLTVNTASVLSDFDKTTGRRANTKDQEMYLIIKGQLDAADAVSRGMGTLSGDVFTPTIDKGFDEAHKSNVDVKWGRA
jgi:hypothetical protein